MRARYTRVNIKKNDHCPNNNIAIHNKQKTVVFFLLTYYNLKLADF